MTNLLVRNIGNTRNLQRTDSSYYKKHTNIGDINFAEKRAYDRDMHKTISKLNINERVIRQNINDAHDMDYSSRYPGYFLCPANFARCKQSGILLAAGD